MLSLLLFSFVSAQTIEIKLNTYPFKDAYQGTLSSQAFYFSAEDFDRDGDDGEVVVKEGAAPLPYKVWLQEDPAPLVIVLPGFGSHHRSSNNLRLAETLYNHGYSVVSASNVFNFEFLESALSSAVPGYTPRDARDLHKVLRLILEDIKKNNEDVVIQKIGVTGYSHGGLHTLFLAHIEEDLGDDAIGIESFVAINPPIDPEYSLSFLDESYEIYQSWSEQERKTHYLNFTLNLKSMTESRNEKDQTKYLKGIPSQVAQVAIATAFRTSLREILQVSLSLGNLDQLIAAGKLKDLEVGWSNKFRRELYEAIEKNFNFRRYISDIVVPDCLSKMPSKSTSDLIFDSSLRSIESTLRNNNKIKIIHNKDDILMHTSDRLDWLKQVAGSKLVLFDKGGHVGNLYMPEVQKVYLKSFF